MPILRATPETGEWWDDPSEDLLYELLGDLGPSNDFFVHDRMDLPANEYYAQVALMEDGTYLVEYRNGSAAEHYQARTPSRRDAHAALVGWSYAIPEKLAVLTWTPLE